MHVEHLQLGLGAGIADRHPGHEPVALGLGQGIRALHLDRVLRGHDHERVGQLVGVAVDGDLTLLHRLQERGLGLGRSAVDLVADHDLGEDRARFELEVAALLIEDGHTGDVRGQQIRCELDAPHRAVDRPGQRLGQHGLAHPGHVLDQQMALREQHGQREAYDLGLALDHTLHRPAHPLHCGGQICEARSIVIGRHPALLGPAPRSPGAAGFPSHGPVPLCGPAHPETRIPRRTRGPTGCHTRILVAVTASCHSPVDNWSRYVGLGGIFAAGMCPSGIPVRGNRKDLHP